MKSSILKRIQGLTSEINDMLEEKQILQRKLNNLQNRMDVSCGVLIELKHIIEECELEEHTASELDQQKDVN
jgi:hypothetical protein